MLASSWRGYDDVVIHGQTGERFKAGNPESLAAALRRLLNDEGARAAFGVAGRQRVSELFRWDKVAARVQGVYDGALAPGGKPR